MTEEIIIDGVNVAGCEKLGETVDGITCGLGKRIRFANEIITKHNLCKDNPDCYYKQLKRLEKEVKHWQMECREAKAKGEWTYDLVRKKVDRLEQENKELRQQYNCYACDTCQGKEDYRNMKRHCKNAIKTVHTYRSALEEIREIVMESKPVDEPISQTEFTVRRMDLQTNKLIRVLAKINEVLGNENN